MAKNIEGTVVQTFSRARFSSATVRLEPQAGTEGAVALANSDEDGRFQINIDTLTPGSYVLTAFHPEAGPSAPRKSVTISEAKDIIIEGEEDEARIELELDPRNIVSGAAGGTFLFFILLTLVGLAVYYCYLHKKYPDKSIPLNKQISILLKQAVDEASKKPSIKYKLVKEKTDAASKMVEAMKQAETIEQDIFATVGKLSNNLNSSIERAQNEANKKNPNSNILQTLNKEILSYLRLIDGSLRASNGYFWQENPWNLLEMLFWAVAATLIRLAMNAGRYLRWRNFHANAIPHHIGYLFAVPIMAVLIALVLSFLNVDFKLGGSGVSLDFSNVVVSIVIASFVGLTPWRASEFLQKLADYFFTRLGRAVPGENGNATPQQPDIKIEPSPAQGEAVPETEPHPDEVLEPMASPYSEPVHIRHPI